MVCNFRTTWLNSSHICIVAPVIAASRLETRLASRIHATTQVADVDLVLDVPGLAIYNSAFV